MKSNLIPCIVVLTLITAPFVWGAESVPPALQKGLLEEEVNQNLDAAIKAYQSVLNQFQEQRKVAATAAFRLGECYRKQGRTNEAFAEFERVLRDFPDQDALARLSQKYLSEAGPRGAVPVLGDLPLMGRLFKAGSSPSSYLSYTNSQGEVVPLPSSGAALNPEQVKLVRDEIALVNQQIDAVQRQAGNGKAVSADVIAVKRQLIPLELALPENAAPDKQQALINQDIGYVQRLLQDVQKLMEVGQAAPLDQIPLKRQLLELQRALLAVQQPKQAGFQTRLQSVVRREDNQGPTDEETKEIERIQEMIKNSPDLINAPSQGSNGDLTPLQSAARQGQLVVARFLLDNGADVNVKGGGFAYTALHLAAYFGHKAIVELLLARGAQVNAQDKDLSTPLHSVAERGYQAVAEVLLAHGADVDAKNSSGRTPLSEAAANGHQSMIELLLQHKADINAQDNIGWTPLIRAIHQQQHDTADLLVRKGADVNLRAERGQTALTVSLQTKDDSITKLLLEHKADPNVETEFSVSGIQAGSKLSPLLYTLVRRQIPMTELLLEHGANPNVYFESRGNAMGGPEIWAGDTPLIFAVRAGNTSLVESLLKAGAKVDGQGYAGVTALELAAGRPNVALVNLLLAKRANANLKDTQGDTALLAPLFSSDKNPAPVGQSRRRTSLDPARKQILDALLAHGADVNATNNHCLTPLKRAIELGDTNLVQALIAHQADVNQATSCDMPPLLQATQLDDETLVSVLLSGGANPNQKAHLGYTALDMAAANSYTNVMQLLLEHEADPNIQDDRGNTPLHYAAFNGHLAAVQMLLAHGAKLDIVDRDGATPTDLASAAAEVKSYWGGIPNVVFNRGPGSVLRDDGHRAVRELLQQAAKAQPSGSKE